MESKAILIDGALGYFDNFKLMEIKLLLWSFKILWSKMVINVFKGKEMNSSI